MTDQQIFEEYYDTLITLELSVLFAKRDSRKVNEAIRNTWFVIQQRVHNPSTIKIFHSLCKNIFPAGALAMIRRQFDKAVSNG